MTDTPEPPTNAAMLKRLRLIDFLVDNYGAVKRRFLMDYFGISTQQASLDLRVYQEQAPGNIVYDRVLRAYRRTPAYKRKFP